MVSSSGNNANTLNTNIYETKKVEKVTSIGSIGESVREVAPSISREKITVVNSAENLRSSHLIDNTVRTTVLPAVTLIPTASTVIRTAQPMTSSRVITTAQTNQVPLINSTITMGNNVSTFGQPKAITTVTKNEK